MLAEQPSSIDLHNIQPIQFETETHLFLRLSLLRTSLCLLPTSLPLAPSSSLLILTLILLPSILQLIDALLSLLLGLQELLLLGLPVCRVSGGLVAGEELALLLALVRDV